ncbi:hypothetical protein G7Y89_g621 [Cudoniella acicularis]|uniref:PhoD-like phosphatase domain-containing protein n=1 Tax=Cudoniella acicularis TaxID=354080 RepID=A0A8H4RXP3_9HELO|nr:hypothetical protein G7Y89_g621 [Cudoniella acicularis]
MATGSTPYWGKLPPPEIVRGNSIKRDRGQSGQGKSDLSVDTGFATDRLSNQFQPSPQRKQNRNSTQTEAPTVSTQSPFVSPTDETFGVAGLAPRPPSFPYNAPPPANSDHLEKRRRRESRNRDQFLEEQAASVPPPAAPDAPRAPPPVSYKQPHNGEPSSSYKTPTRSGSTRRSEGPVSSSQGVADDYFRSNHREDYPSPEQASQRRRPSNGKAAVGIGENEWDEGKQEKIDTPHRSRRQGSLSESEYRKRDWAPDRSPLQRLELTLDSITKEEKRARVEEAELLAKEGRTRGSERTQNPVHFRNRRVAKDPVSGTKLDSQNSNQDDLPRNASSRRKIQSQRSSTAGKRPVTFDIPDTDTVAEAVDRQKQVERSPSQKRDASSAPQKGKSFRDRSYIPVPVAITGGAGSSKLGRSGSNKLKKEPPGDPWLHRRVDAEKQFQEVTPRRPSVADQQSPGPSKDTAFRSHPQVSVDKELPSLPPEARQTGEYLAHSSEFDSVEDMDPKPVRRGTLSKIERLTGQKVPSQSPTQAGRDQRSRVVDVNGNKYDLPPTTPGTAARGAMPHESAEHHHHLPNVLHRKHENVPGQTVYVPSRRLDEWKKGGVAQLSGSLLDLDVDEQNELEKDKAWWEAGNTGRRRRSTSTNQRRAEAYDGEYDDSNGTDLQSSPSNTECAGCASERKNPGRIRKVLTLVNLRSRLYFGYDKKSKKRVAANSDDVLDASDDESPHRTTDPSHLSPNHLTVPPHLSSHKSDPNLSLHHAKSSLKPHSLTCPMRAIRVRPDIAPTRFKPPLFLRSGPLLRYCGLRREPIQNRSLRPPGTTEREIWRGSVMIVTQDDHSSYELAPTLRLFLQPIDLLPPPPAQVDDEELAPEYIDPLAGLPKIGRDGRTLYIRPVDHLDEERDISRVESDEGLFETERSPLDGASDRKCVKPHYDGEKAGKYKEVRGFRLHAERGVTFWRFNLEIELRDKQQRLAYRINRGPATAFWVPARDQPMNIMFHSCNGFSYNADPHAFNGPDPMWRDILNTHQTQPFHVMLGGGDQIYNDVVMQETKHVKEWTDIKTAHHKESVPFTAELQNELESFYLNRYCMWFSQGLFGLATSQIPMINVWDDHDIIDGYGSYPHDEMRCPVMAGLGAVAFKYYMLFQHQSSIDEGEETEPHWILGDVPGPYIGELSRSVFTHLGRSVAFLGLDCRTERMNDEIVSAETYEKVFDRLEKEIVKGETKHLIVLVGIPVAYPRMVWLENILTSRLMDPIKALGRAGLLGQNLLNHFDGGVEILDDLDDHWTAKHHKAERNWFIQELQDLAAEKSVRVTILGGDVHLAAVGQFFSNPKLGLPKDRDNRYMPNIISSAIVNAPPPDTLADVLNKRNKVHHLDLDTDEEMIPIFTHDVTGKARNNKCLLNRRNWCSIRAYDPELSPPPTPQTNGTVTPPPSRGGLFRRISTSRGPSYRPDVSAPPLSSAGFFNRRPSASRRGSTDSQRPALLTRTLSLTRKDFNPGSLFRRNSKRKPDSGGINGYGADSDDDESQYHSQPRMAGIRGGSGGSDEDSYFPAMDQPSGRDPEHPVDQASTSIAGTQPQKSFSKSQYHRVPTGLSEKQKRLGGNHVVNLKGGLDICLNVEVNHKDPAGITMPYRILVPALWYQEEQEGEAAQKVVGIATWDVGTCRHEELPASHCFRQQIPLAVFAFSTTPKNKIKTFQTVLYLAPRLKRNRRAKNSAMADSTLEWALGKLEIDLEDAPGYEDGWLSWAGLDPNKVIPAIPPIYREEEGEQRALYITGFPAVTSPIEMKHFFTRYGTVDKSICVVDMISRFSFRWVVMKTTEGAGRVLKNVHCLVVEDEDDDGNTRTYVLRVCQAVGPDSHLTMAAELQVDQTDISLMSPDDIATHSHPSPPCKSPSPTSEKEVTLCTELEEDNPSEVQDEPATSPGIPTVVTSPPSDGFTTQAASWANIAGTASPNSRIIDLHPAGKASAGPRLKPVGRIPSISKLGSGEAMVDQMRVVFLLDLPQNLGLQDISDAVTEGPLRSINFGVDETKNTRFAGVVFQYAKDAELFYQTLCKERIDSRPERFKFVVEAIRGEPFPADEPLKAMGSPTFASRRLTIVKSKFFFMFGERQLKALCEKLVGSDAIQLIWLYNGGNATIVFADVASAISVKNALDKMSSGRGLPGGQAAATWAGLQTTFSKDPCVQPLELKTAMTSL